MSEYAWESYRCEWPGCHDAASHTLYVNDEPVARYCAAHANEKANALDDYWHDLEDMLDALEPGDVVAAVEALLSRCPREKGSEGVNER